VKGIDQKKEGGAREKYDVIKVSRSTKVGGSIWSRNVFTLLITKGDQKKGGRCYSRMKSRGERRTE